MTLVNTVDLTEDVLRRAYGMFPSGVTAVCARIGGVPVGMAASSFTSVSIDPPLVSLCVARTSTTWPKLRAAGRVGISVLGEKHGDVVRALSARTGDRFADIEWETTDGGEVLVHGSSLWLECAIETEVAAGDHDIVVFRVLAVRPWPDVSPIVFHASGFRQLIAPEPAKRDTEYPVAADRRDLFAREERRCRAVSESDLATLSELLADELMHTHVNGMTQTKTEYLAGLGSRPRSVTRSGLAVQVLGDVALMRGQLENRFPDTPVGAPARQLQVLQVWVRRSGWQQVAFTCAAPPREPLGVGAPPA